MVYADRPNQHAHSERGEVGKTPMRAWITAAVLLTQSGSIAGQDVVWERKGILDQSRINGQIVPLSDLNNDGYREVAWLHDVMVGQQGGSRHLHLMVETACGRTGRSLRASFVSKSGTYIGFHPLGDLNEDGFDDYGIGYRNGFQLPLFDNLEARCGRTDRILWDTGPRYPNQSQFGKVAAGGGDADGDGHDDVIVDASRFSTYGSLFLLDRFGNEMRRIDGTRRLRLGGAGWFSTAFVGDLDGDGCDDAVVAFIHVEIAGAEEHGE